LELRVAAADFPDKSALIDRLTDRFTDFSLPEHTCAYPAKSIWAAYFDIAWQLFQSEGFTRLSPPRYTDEVGKGRYADYLLAHRRKIENPAESMTVFVDSVTT